MLSKSSRAVAVGIFLWCSLVSMASYAQEAFTIPRSDRVIFGELTLPDNSKARFVVRDGTWVTVEDRKAKYFFGFNGIINDETGNPNFVPYLLNRVSAEETEVVELNMSSAAEYTSPDRAVAARDIPIGKRASYSSARGIKLKVTGVGEWDFAAPYVSDVSQYSTEELQQAFGFEQDFGVSGNGICCITCQGRTICATRVSTSCGSCDGGSGGALAY